MEKFPKSQLEKQYLNTIGKQIGAAIHLIVLVVEFEGFHISLSEFNFVFDNAISSILNISFKFI